MKIKHLLESLEPKLPGAAAGIEIMTPQQFITKSAAGEMPQDRSTRSDVYMPDRFKPVRFTQKLSLKEKDLAESAEELSIGDPVIITGSVQYNGETGSIADFGKDKRFVVVKLDNYGPHSFHSSDVSPHNDDNDGFYVIIASEEDGVFIGALVKDGGRWRESVVGGEKPYNWGGDYMSYLTPQDIMQHLKNDYSRHYQVVGPFYDKDDALFYAQQHFDYGLDDLQGVTEDQEHLDRIRRLSGLSEATKLPASSREFSGDEFQDYMKRIVGTPDVDKSGNVKVDKKGVEKYVSGKTKTDKYKMPYIHRSSVVEYLGPDGETYDEDKVKQTLAIRPKALLKQNEKMKHSNGELEQFFNVGFAALTGIALDEETNKLIIVNTCPGAGSCKVDCFAMKGGKIQFKAAWQSDGRILTYLLNDPDGFFHQLSAEIAKEERLGDKGGYTVTIRWHDAGDFFSPEYLDLALKMAEKHPGVKFYAYTKMANAILAKKPGNFIINWSEGAHTSQEKQVKAQDPTLAHTKNSRIVPTELFGDLLAKDAKGNLAKGSEGQWVIIPNKLHELKHRLAKEYGISASSILGYDEWEVKTRGGKKETPVKYNVIIAPGEPDLTANSHGVLSTLLLKH